MACLPTSIGSAILLLILGGGSIVREASGAAATQPATVDFVREIQPLFASACYDCHGPNKQKGGLRLDVRDSAMAGGTSGRSILLGKGKESLLVHRLLGLGDEERMPVKKDPLTDAQIALISAWIDQGAAWPDEAAGVATQVTHWSFVKPVRPAEPCVTRAEWPRNAVDRFVLARLEHEGLSPAPEAAREALLRRVCLDLTGLPPTPAEIDAHLIDDLPDAYERQVERLLASPHFGERWGKHWLDAARYADSNGYSQDSARTIWRYRDWVIDAINRDLPFDRFATEQLAGDLLPNATIEQRIATGFHRNTMLNQEGGIDREQFRIESVIDRVNTTGSVFLGLTVGCAQCHNHKFDPIAQREYFQLFAFLNNQEEPTLTVRDPAGTGAMPAMETSARGSSAKDVKKKADGTTTLVLSERPQPRESYVFIKGDFTRKGEVVSPGVPRVLHAFKPADVSKANRLDLARWIVDPENPLTARVTVNRLWQEYFGRGIVETENDFGTQGTPPTHPELLDWLATELVRGGWNMKAMHRLIVTSATYRQSSDARGELANVDPGNRLLGRQSRLRLDAEIVRDVALSASGLLSPKIGGPSVFPPQPEGVTDRGQVKKEWTPSRGPDRYRRGMYTFLYRATPHPLLNAFDAPDGQSTCTRRIRSNTPLQALTLLNDEAFVECAQALAGRLLKEGPSGDAGRIGFAFKLSVGRMPADQERAVIEELLAKQRGAFEKTPAEAKALAGETCPPNVAPAEFAAWTIVSRVLLNLDETITR